MSIEVRALKIAGFVAGGLVALLIVVLLAVWLFVDPNDYKGRIAQAVKDSTGRDLSLPGDIKLSVFPWVALELGPASLGNPPGFANEPFAKIQHAVLRVKLLPLLHKRLQIGRIDVTAPDLRLERNADGKGNWEGFAEKNPSAPAKGGGGETLQELAGLNITDGRLAYQDRILEHINAAVGRVSGRSPVPVKVSMDLINGRASLPIHIAGQFDITADFATKQYRLAGLQANGSAAQSSTAPIHWDIVAPDMRLDLARQTVAIPDVRIGLAAARLKASISGSKIVDGPTLNGSFQLAPLALRDFMTQLGMSPPVTRDSRALSKLSASGNYSYGDNALHADRLDMRLDDSTLRGRAAITNLDTVALSFDLALDRIDFDRYRAPASTANAPPAAKDKAVDSITTPLKSLNASGAMAIGAARFSGINFTHVSVGVLAKDGVIHIAPAKAQLYGGQYSANVTLDAHTSQSTLIIDQTMSSIDVAQLLNDFAKTRRLSGRGNVNSHLTAQGNTGESIIRTLSGHIDVNLANGAVEGIDLWYEINRAQSLLKQQAPPAGSSTGHTPFDTFKASAQLIDGIATTKDLNIASQLLHITGEGSTNLTSQAIDYEVKATVLKSMSPTVKSANSPTLVEIPVKISGTVSRPTARPDLEGMAKARVQQELDKHKDELQKKVEEQLQNLFKPHSKPGR